MASGASEYSPAEIPPSWRAVAVEWSASVGATSGRAPQRVEASASPPASEKTKLLESTETCAPVLLYLASLEYRGRIGNERIPPVFPRVTRASTRALEQGLAFRKGIRCFKD
ncbi:MAG TPA: hypothetical protein VN450_00490 [Candidatus Methylomirabilis sp.]|nr:hypothetical protein [Candidatus Methylomirabilis sp.]